MGATGALGMFSGPARADDLRTQILQIPGVNKGSPTDGDWQKVGELCLGATKANVKEGEFKGVELTLHGTQQPESAQPAVPRLPETVGSLHGREADLDRSRPGRLQSAAAAGASRPARSTSTSSRWARRSRAMSAARAWRRRCRTGSKRQIDMDDYVGYLKAAGRNLERQDLPHLDRRRLPQLQLSHRLLLRCRPGQGLEGCGRPGRMGRAEDLAAGPGGDQVPEGQEDQRPGRLRLSRSDEADGAVSPSTSSAAAPAPTPSTRTTRRGCSTSTP